jgi:conjugative transfer signal peptidase TraF
MSQCQLIALWLVGTGAIMALGIPGNPTWRLVYNPTTSAPTGWYWVTTAGDLKVADYVLARLPKDAALLANDRQYLPKSVPLLKRVGAVREQQVCLSGDTIFVDGRPLAVTLSQDGRGRKLTAWTHCRALASDELFLLSDTNPAAFDSRYFGPIQVRNVIGKAIPLWIW